MKGKGDYMKISDMVLQKPAVFDWLTPVKEALSCLNEAGCFYGIVLKENHLIGYITSSHLVKQKKFLPLYKCVIPVELEIPLSTDLAEIKESLGEAIIVYDAPGHYTGILDKKSLLETLQSLAQENRELKEKLLEQKSESCSQDARMPRSCSLSEDKNNSKEQKGRKTVGHSFQAKPPAPVEIITKSPGMLKLLSLAEKVAKVNTTVLLLGETGVGKGLVARYIHQNSDRRENPFIPINCGAIPENLLETELFGYEPGAFTGATSKGKIGRIESAGQGTLFFDEIGDLPMTLQVKLLHVLQYDSFTRVGGTREIKANVRFLAATNKDLSQMIGQGLFREDLYFRLNVVPLEIPPLRQRREDILLLAEEMLAKFLRKYPRKKTFGDLTLRYLENYSWPGNVRELENIIEKMVILANEEVLEPHHLPLNIIDSYLAQRTAENPTTENGSLNNMKDTVEKSILEGLYKEGHSTYQMAEVLKVNQSTIARKLKKYKIT
jgi:TyrR family helix-turn-helix protein